MKNSMSIIETMAWFVILLSVVKLVVVLVKPKVWLDKVVKPIYSHSAWQWVFLALGLGGLYFLFPSLDAVQFFAILFVFMFLMAASFMPYAKDILPSFEGMYKNRALVWKKSWAAVVVWLALLAWGISALVR